MTSDIAAILGIDGIATGAVYALVAIGTVLIFTVTRVIFIPFGDIAAFTALTLAALDAKRFPGTGALVVILACLATIIEIISLVRARELRLLPRALFFYLALPEPLTSFSTEFAGVLVSGQTMLIVIAALVFSGLLYLFFDFTLVGKSLRATAVNRTGSRLMGIRPARAGTIAYLLGSLMAGVSGILIAPVNTVFYDSGFLIGLKAFVGAIVGGMTSYPGAAIGAVGVGILESFASFESSALKDVIVFSLLIPILIWRSLASLHSEEEIEE